MKENGSIVHYAKGNFKIKEILEDTLKTFTKEITPSDVINVEEDFLIEPP